MAVAGWGNVSPTNPVIFAPLEYPCQVYNITVSEAKLLITGMGIFYGISFNKEGYSHSNIVIFDGVDISGRILFMFTKSSSILSYTFIPPHPIALTDGLFITTQTNAADPDNLTIYYQKITEGV